MLYAAGPLSGPELGRLRKDARIPARVLGAAVGVSRSRISAVELTAQPSSDITARYLTALSQLIAERDAV